jgi:hypothetical protein
MAKPKEAFENKRGILAGRGDEIHLSPRNGAQYCDGRCVSQGLSAIMRGNLPLIAQENSEK